MGFTAVFLAGTVLLFYSIYLYIAGFSAWLEGIPFDVASKLVTHSSLRTYQLLDVCQNFLGNGKELERTRWYSHYEHASGYNGVPFADALPQWVNNATNLITLLSSAVLAERAVGSSYNQNSNEFATQFKKFLFVNSAQMRRNYSCAFKLGESDHLGEITWCQEDYQKEIYNSVEQNPETSDAMIQFRRLHYKYGFKAPSNLLVRLSINRNHLNTQRYPQVDYSPNPAAIDDVLRVSTQRHLMQLGNQLTLPEAVADRISNNLQAMTMTQLNDMLSKLRLWESVSHADNLALTTLVRSIFDANQIALTSDVGCDFDLESGIFKMLSCFQGSARDIPNGAPIPEAAQVWFARAAGNGVNYIEAFANKVPVAEAMATWLKQSTDAMENLWGVADTLHHRVCNGTSDDQIELLRKAAQRELIDHGADLSSDVGCDLRFNDAGIEEILCHAGTAPQLKVAGCDLESNVPVRWEGKLWLQPHALNPEWLDKVIVAASPVWQESRTQMRPYSPSLKITDSVLPIDSDSTSNEESLKVTQSGTNMGTDSDTSTGSDTDSISAEMSGELTSSGSGSPSNEMSQQVTGTDSGTDTDSNTGRLSNEISDELTSSGSGTTSRETSDELTFSGSGSPSNATMPYSPTFPNANTTGDGITELYYLSVDQEVRRAFLNATHKLNDTLFLSNTSFGTARLGYGGVHVDVEFPKMYWSGANSTNNQWNNIYVADILSNPTRLNNTRIIYSAPSKVWSLYLAKGINRMFWGAQDRGMYMGIVNITNFVNMTNITAQSMISTNSFLPFGFYYDLYTQALLWSRPGGSPTRYFIYKSTLNLQTEMLVNTTILLNASNPIESLSYDVKNRRILFYYPNEAILGIASFNFEIPMPLTNITEIPNFQGILSVVND